MAKRPDLEHVKYVRAKGRDYAYFNTGRKNDGKPIYTALGRPGSQGFFDRYASALAGRNRKPGTLYTVANLCADYQDSKEFREGLAAGSRKAYGVYLRVVADLLGDAPVDGLTRADIRLVLENEDWGPGKRNLFVATIGAAYKWGREHDKTLNAPAREIANAKTGEHLAWPDDVLEAGLEAKTDVIRLGVNLLFYTGQRIGDACKMRWSDVKDGRIKVVQQKTRKSMVVPIHSELQAELDRQGKRGLTLLTNPVGGPLHPDALRAELKAFVAAQGHPDLRPHGLRKNAVIALLTAGCSVAETAAITGQTYQLVEYYARQIDQGRMADAAILKLEQRGVRKTAGKTGAEGGGKT